MTIVFADRERGQGRGYWHKLGSTFEGEDVTASEAAIEAGLNYDVTVQPIATQLPDGTPLDIPNNFAVVSEHDAGNPQAIAVVGPQFQPIPNMHIAEMMDRAGLVGPGGLYQMDTAGATADGRRVFWSMKARSEHIVAGDEYRDHWIITDGKDGGSALTMALTPVRVVCSNALAMAVAGASIKVGISHTAAAAEELEWWLGIASQLQAASAKARGILEVMANTPATDEMVDDVLNAAYPRFKLSGRARLMEQLPHLELGEDAGKSVERAVEKNQMANLRILARREFARDVFLNYANDPEEHRIAGTLLGITSAIVDCENHREASSAREDVALSNFNGPRYQTIARATKRAVALIG